MGMQLSIFDPEVRSALTEVYPRADYGDNGKGGNYRKGEEQTVYPFKTREELEAMAAYLKRGDPKYLLCFVLGVNLGLRASELLSLRCSDIFYPDGEIRCVPDDYADTSDKISVYQDKVDKRRGLFLNRSCVNAIRWYYGDGRNHYFDGYVFPSREGGHIGVDALRKVLKQAAKACGIERNIGTHSLRKTFGYFHFQANHDIVFLQRLFRHSNALTTMRYIGVAEEDEKRAYHDVSLDLIGDVGASSVRSAS